MGIILVVVKLMRLIKPIHGFALFHLSSRHREIITDCMYDVKPKAYVIGAHDIIILIDTSCYHFIISSF